jgi:hypothetical protein
MRIYCAALLGILWLNAANGLESNFTENEYAEVEKIQSGDSESMTTLYTLIHQQILPTLPNKKAFLDIGAGPGEIAKQIGKYFDSTTVIDPNSTYLDGYNRLGFVAFISKLQDIALSDSYDFILCSHVFYYIERNNWMREIQKIYSGIAQGGKGLFAYVAPIGPWHDFCLSIRPDYSTSSDIEQIFLEESIPYRRMRHSCKYQISDVSDFQRLVSLCVLDDCFTPEQYQSLSEEKKSEINKKIEAFIITCKTPNGYVVNADQDFFILDKE